MSYDSLLFFLNYSCPFSRAAMCHQIHPNLFSPKQISSSINMVINMMSMYSLYGFTREFLSVSSESNMAETGIWAIFRNMCIPPLFNSRRWRVDDNFRNYKNDGNMADSVTVDAAANATLNETAGNATAKVPATIEGMSVAYLSLFLMAVFPIFIGSFRSVKHHQEQKVMFFY